MSSAGHRWAWGKGTVAIANQVRLTIITSLLVAILLHTRLGTEGAQDVKSLAKQAKRQKAKADDPDGTDRPNWTAPPVPLYRQGEPPGSTVLQTPILKPASPGLYERERGPMLRAYL
jgi:hypothetical protein